MCVIEGLHENGPHSGKPSISAVYFPVIPYTNLTWLAIGDIILKRRKIVGYGLLFCTSNPFKMGSTPTGKNLLPMT